MRYSVTIPHKIYLTPTVPQLWAQDNCPSYLSATLWLKEEPESSTAEFHFADEHDATVFSLRWL